MEWSDFPIVDETEETSSGVSSDSALDRSRFPVVEPDSEPAKEKDWSDFPVVDDGVDDSPPAGDGEEDWSAFPVVDEDPESESVSDRVKSPAEAAELEKWNAYPSEDGPYANPYAGMEPEEAEKTYQQALKRDKQGLLGQVGTGLKQYGLGLVNALDKAVGFWEEHSMYGREDQGGEVFAPAAREASKDLSQVSQAAYGDRIWPKAVESATRSIAQAATLGYAGIPMIPGFAALRGSDAQDEAAEAGLEGWSKLGYVGRAMVIEGGLTYAFQRVGLGGFEKYFGKTPIKPQSLMDFAKDFPVQLVAELTEESAVEIADAYNAKLSGVQEGDIDHMALLKEVWASTALAVGVGAGQSRVRQQRVTRQMTADAEKALVGLGLDEQRAKETVDRAWAQRPESGEEFYAALSQSAMETADDLLAGRNPGTVLNELSPEQRAEADAMAPVVMDDPRGKQNAPKGEEIATESSLDQQTVRLPVADLVLSKDVPNFKEDSDPNTGVVAGQELSGEYNELGTAPIVVWERLDGRREVISGRHRLDLARRTGKQDIPAHVLREADGFDAVDAMTLDSELNIRDGQGAVKDYANYFRNNENLTEQEASGRGLLARAKGRSGWAVGRLSEDNLYTAYRNGQIAETKAVAIAEAAPYDDAMQRVGMEYALQNKQAGAEEIRQYINAVRSMTGAQPSADQMDLFGANDSAMEQARDMAKAAVKIRRGLEQERTVLRSAKKVSKVSGDQASILERYGVTSGDVDAINAKLAELDGEIEAWGRWATDPVKVQQVREAVGMVETRGQSADVGGQDGNALTLEQQSPQDVEAERQRQAALEARAKAEERMAAPLQGNSRDVGQGQLFDDPNTGGQQDLLGGLTAEAQAARAAKGNIVKQDDYGNMIEQQNGMLYVWGTKEGKPGEKTTEIERAFLKSEESKAVLYLNYLTKESEKLDKLRARLDAIYRKPLSAQESTGTPTDAAQEALTLEQQSPQDVEAERQRQAALEARAKAEERMGAPLTGNTGDMGQARLFNDEAQPGLFEGPSAEDQASFRNPESPAQGSSDARNDADYRNRGRDLPVEPARPGESPNWAKEGGETKQGRSVIEAVEGKTKRSVGLGDIVDLLNKVVGVEMRRSSSQTSRKHPAFYRRLAHLTMTRDTQSQINYHEAGHGIAYMLDERMGVTSPMRNPQVVQALLELTRREGSMASAENVQEGMAEYVRLKVVNPAAVEGGLVDQSVGAALQSAMPDVAAGLRDTARAYQRFMNLPAAERWAAVNRGRQGKAGFKEMLNAAIRLGESVVSSMASGAPVSKLDRRIARMAFREYKNQGEMAKVAAEKMRTVRRKTTDLIEAHNIILQIGAETQLAYSGKGPARGIRYFTREGKAETILNKTWNEIIHKVPGKHHEQFEQAGWALEHLNRWRDGKLEYPGMKDGITPQDLEGIVAKARKEIPDFQKHFDEVQEYFDSLLLLREMAGMLEEGELARIKKRETYWPLPRVMNGPGGVRSGPGGMDMQTGLRRASGSGEATMDLNTAAETYTRQAFSAVYWNQFAQQSFENLKALALDKSLPEDVRVEAGRVMVPLTMKQKPVASLSKAEALNMVYDGVVDSIARETGESVESVMEWFKPDNVNLSWSFKDIYRPSRPNDVNVLSFIETGGQRQYVQIKDDAFYMMFAKAEQVSKFFQGAQWLTGPMIENWKRNITQFLLFAVNNVKGDMVNQMAMNPDKVGWVPGGATMIGIMHKFSKKYPQVFQEGLLLSRVQPSSSELMNEVKHNAVMRFMTEGLYISQHKDPTVRLLQTALNPSNWLYPVWKTADVVNLVTGGRTLSPLLESATREGAAVKTLEGGGTDRAAMLAYWNVTGPFNEHSGNADIRAALSMPGFFNPMLQALRRSGQLMTDPDPDIRNATLLKVMVEVPAIFGLAAALRYALMSEEEKEWERERALDDRLNYHNVGGFRARFPYGVEGAMASLVYNSVMDDLLDRKRVDGKRKSVQLMKRIVDGGNVTQFLGPQFNTLTEASSNWSNFRQRHIVSPWLSGLPASEQANAHTPEFYRKLGAWMDYSPTKIQYVVQQALNRQTDEIIKMLDSLARDKPVVMERADIPFVGRMFIRNPYGWGAQSMEDLSKLEEKLDVVDLRLKNMGWSWVKNEPIENIPTRDLLNLRVQLDQLEALRKSVRQMPRYSQLAKAYRTGERWEEEQNVMKAMVIHAQSALMSNDEEMHRLDVVLELLEQIGDAPPAVKEADYRRRTNL